ncbi:MAG: glutaredoxin family protein [Betaproteobacteria bacterium]|nr:glutaredoxin family protein [Betaproteobacteria bacterium]
MKKSIRFLLLAWIFGNSALLCAAEVYRWTDEKGQAVYSDLPPPPNIKKLEEKAMRGSQIEVDKQSYATRKAAEAFPVSLYTAPDDKCPGCPLAKQYLANRNIPYNEVSLQTSAQMVEALKVLGGEDVEVPSLLIGSKAYKGYSASEWDAALDAAGYPKGKP